MKSQNLFGVQMGFGLRKSMGTHFQALFGIWVLAMTSFFPIDCLAKRTLQGDPPGYKPTHSRFNEIKDECKSVLAEASVLPPDRSRKYMIQNELSFSNGDWKQGKGSPPLIPFREDATNSNYTRSSPRRNFSPIKLASFWIEDVDPNESSAKMVNVSGILQLALSKTRPISDHQFYMPSISKDFEIYPGYTTLTIHLEGTYLELKNSQEERLLCMLGSTHLPSRGARTASESQSPTLSELDDKFLLHLRYPSKLSLTTREIQGTLTSLNQPSNSNYFDGIYISSQLTAAYSKYEFDSEGLVAKACYPPHNFQSEGVEIYRGDSKTVIQLMTGQFLDVIPNWQCNGKNDYCSKLGPFIEDAEVHGTNGGSDNTKKLYVQDLIPQNSNSGTVESETTTVRAVFRVVPPSQYHYLATKRSGLNGLTLPAEGQLNSSSGQLCMVGCLGSVKNGDSACNSRICIYSLLSFSIKQRSLIVGSISSIEDSPNSFYPLSFELLHIPRYSPFSSEVLNKMSYSYSKTKLAESMLKKEEQTMKPFWKYPRKKLDNTRRSFSLLSEDLSVKSSGIFEPLSKRHSIDLYVIAIEEFVRVGWDQSTSVISKEDRESPHSKGPEEQKFLKVAAHLRVKGNFNFSMLSVEGFYDPRVGRMYLIGCRDVRAQWKVLHQSGDLEDGFDCLIELKVEYPPTNTWWFMNPTMKLSVRSQRPKDDPLFFRQIKIQNLPIMYQSQRKEINSVKTVEGVLRILTPSLMIVCILSQLFYSRQNTEIAPYISLVMLGLQAIGYSIPLITGVEAFFNSMKYSPYFISSQSRGSERIDYMVKLLLLIACLLTLRLCQKVWKSRIRLLTRSPLEPWKVPSEKRVLVISSAIHAMGFLIVLIVHTVRSGIRPFQSSTYWDSDRNVHTQHEWEIELRKYVVLVPYFFLLPQIVGNILWHFERKPLRKLYYIGITGLQLLPHFYDYLGPLVFNPYFANYGPEFSIFGYIAIPVTSLVLAIVIFIQQRWNKLTGQALRLVSSKMTLPGTRVYERLPSKTYEAELVSGCTETGQVRSTELVSGWTETGQAHSTAQDKGKVSSL